MTQSNKTLVQDFKEFEERIKKIRHFQPFIQSDVDRTFETLRDNYDADAEQKWEFLGRRYYGLVGLLRSAGIIELPEIFKDGLE